ncbi:type IV pilin [Salinigranum halophilum]|uniref:type IV pilin n=1 Tax=Salinigranum halophilum TaxID=2565931 RepID=UPI0010A92B46|nr:type IV pilin N-terminal domain-containing protein [Salinigranum halophilum]
MNFKQLFTEDRAVSPVIGVILMVAITVILAAVIGTFVLGLGDQVSESAPQAQFTFDFNDEASDGTNTFDIVNITHDGGDAIDPAAVSVDSKLAVGVGAYNSTTGSYADSLEYETDFGVTNDVSAGTTVSISLLDSEGELNGETIRIIWSSPNSDKTATIGQFQP